MSVKQESLPMTQEQRVELEMWRWNAWRLSVALSGHNPPKRRTEKKILERLERNGTADSPDSIAPRPELLERFIAEVTQQEQEWAR